MAPAPMRTYAADFLTTLPTRKLQQILHDTPSLPLARLLNQRDVRVEVEHHRIWRDVYWKGTFAKDHPLGWDEWLLTPSPADGSAFAGGRFWKRFDALHDGVATGHIVNYNVHLLPGKPEVRQVVYPDDRRRYFRAGDDVLLLTYLNQPYRIVYDAFKMVDPDTCIGVMHLGTFPRGLEFATFVMSRNNYPFEHMSVPDHDELFESPHARAPRVEEVAGRWTGRLVFIRRPDHTLHNQFNPRWVGLDVAAGTPPSARLRFGLSSRRLSIATSPDSLRLTAGMHAHHELRMIGDDTLLGRRPQASAGGTGPARRYVLRRLAAAAHSAP